MKQILLFGAGKSATVLIDYLIDQAVAEGWHITIADAQLALIESKTGKAACTTAIAMDIHQESDRRYLVARADLVISLLPPACHILVAADCLYYGKNLLTASYADEAMKALAAPASAKGILFLCEMGLDPGIDHMSAMQLIHDVQAKGGTITSFQSHCGGLVAPESNNNPWQYKISWNPRNIVLAGKAGAAYRQNGQLIRESYEQLFSRQRTTIIEGQGPYCWYPNRNSLDYLSLYGIDCATFIRTTLRPQAFMSGWQNIVALKLTAEDQFYDTDGLSIAGFLHRHFEQNGFSDWITQQLLSNLSSAGDMLKQNLQLLQQEEELRREDALHDGHFLAVNDEGRLQHINLDEAKLDAAQHLVMRLYENNLLLQQLFYLGMNDSETMINKGYCSAATVLQFILEEKLLLQPADRDLVIMQHELEYTIGKQSYHRTATLALKGTDSLHTAMAKTVGLPLGIAARLILNGTLSFTGLHIPVSKAIYEPVLKALAAAGIAFIEHTKPL